MKRPMMLLCGAAAVAMVGSSPAAAQVAGGLETPAAGLNTIIVTAQKRTETLQDVPVSVQVVGGEALEERNETQVDALVKLDPSLTFDEGTADVASGLRVRGVGTQSYSRGVEQSVAIVRDGVVAADAASALLNFNDVERIEVLRGPQGILFGKNASAGLLNIVTRGPTSYFEAGGGVTYGSNDLLLLDGFVSGPVSDTLSARVAGFRNTMDSLIGNAYAPGPEGFNNRDDWGVRGKLRWEPSAIFDVLLTYEHLQRDVNCCAVAGVEYVSGGLAERNQAPVGEENDLAFAPDTSLNRTNLDTIAVEANLETSSGGVITSITGLQNSAYSNDFGAYNTGPATFFILNESRTDTDQLTQELRYTSPEGEAVEFVAGLFYYYNSYYLTLDQRIDIGRFGPAGRFTPGVFGLSRFRTVDSSSTSYAGFASATWNVVNTFRLSAGARLQYDEVEIDAGNYNANDGTFITSIAPQLGERQAQRDDTALSWRLAAEYDVNPDVLLYGSVTRGYKSLGVNSLATVIVAPEPIINPEIPTAFEIGWKSELLDRRLRFNGALFHTTFKDFQAQAIVLDPATQASNFFLATAGELVTKGVEAQVDAQPIDGLVLSAAVTYTDAEYTDFAGAPCYEGQTPAQGCVGGVQDLTGTFLPGVSEWNYNASARYEVPVDPMGIDVYALATYYARSEFNPTSDPATMTDGYGIAELYIGFNTQDDRFGAQIFVRNLFNEFYTTGLTTGGRMQTGYNLSQGLAYDYKRRWGVSASFRF
ncbi:TonB-dependent receptor [Altericroceibacterium xinjiangense]|uniref:TonB-dependent receptor n=1 Tax=Altericroceibacterium xinjiangense TaxID=762261 RepID=UPI000F7E7912|nr:TonB-dependent receptor [Altericroceibacterium xinjiangense]